MAQNINIGTADNAKDGQTLREAFRRIRKNFAEIWGDTDAANLTDTEDLPSASYDSIITEKIEDTVDAMFSGGTHSNITVTYDDSDGTLDLSVAADITDVNAGSGLTGVNEDGGAATLNVGAGDGITVNADDVALASSVAGSGLTYTSGVLSVDAIDTAGISDDAVTAAKLNEFDDTLTAATSGDIIVSNGTDFIHATMSGDATIASGGALTIANDAIDHDNLAARYTAVQTITTTSGTINLDASSYTTFRLTSDLTGATTLNIQNMKNGQVIDITVSGSQTITFSSDDTSETFNKVGGVDYDGASDNHIQVVCIDETNSAAIYNYSIGTYTSDTTP
jgi:hypothetical protein